VNPWAVANINQLFAVNERLAVWLDEKAVMVAVGATMVGKVRVRFDSSMTTNVSGLGARTREYGVQGQIFAKGEELGHFEFGSTIVLVSRTPIKAETGQPVKMGQKLN
jgi:phosphatidylserine decarboxylase